MKIVTIGLDLAKHIFQIHSVDAEGHPLLRRRLRRTQVTGFFANVPPCVVGMEACCGAHYWGRVIGRFGHTVRLIAPQFVKPYVRSAGLLTEYGIILPQHVSQLRRGLPLILEDGTNELTVFSRRLFAASTKNCCLWKKRSRPLTSKSGPSIKPASPANESQRWKESVR